MGHSSRFQLDAMDVIENCCDLDEQMLRRGRLGTASPTFLPCEYVEEISGCLIDGHLGGLKAALPLWTATVCIAPVAAGSEAF